MDMVPRLKQLGIFEVWIRHRDLEFLEDIIDEGLADRQREVYLHVRQNFESILRDATVEIDLVHFQTSIIDLFNFLKVSSGSNILLQKLDTFDNYLMSHSTNVCYLALLLGMKLERYLIDERRHKTAQQAKELHLLGLGCLLHDVGKMRMPPEILRQAGAADAGRRSPRCSSTPLGYEMVRGACRPPAAQVVLNHHQRFNGSGYPAPDGPRHGRAAAAAGGQADSRLLPDRHGGRRLRRGHHAPLLLAGQAAGPGAARDADAAAAATSIRWSRRPFTGSSRRFPSARSSPCPTAWRRRWSISARSIPLRPKVQCLRTADGERFAHPSLEEIDLALYTDLSIVAVNGRDVRTFVEALDAAATPELV